MYYGAIHALKGVSLTVGDGEIVTLIGANGAGKSTTLRAINGLNRAREGSIRFRGSEITTSAPHAIHLHKSPDEMPIYVACADTRKPG